MTTKEYLQQEIFSSLPQPKLGRGIHKTKLHFFLHHEGITISQWNPKTQTARTPALHQWSWSDVIGSDVLINNNIDGKAYGEGDIRQSADGSEAEEVVSESSNRSRVSSSAAQSCVDAYFCVYAYPKKSGEPLGVRKRVCATFTVDDKDTEEENFETAKKWHHKIQICLQKVQAKQNILQAVTLLPDCNGDNCCEVSGCTYALVPHKHSKPLLIFINPKGGTGKALQMLAETVEPILREAGLSYETFITEYSEHALKYMETVEYQRYSAFVILSGDGLIFEILNGLMKRPDWRTAIKTPIGALPAGSGNGLSSTLCFEAGENLLNKLLMSSTYLLTKSAVRPLDLIYMQSADREFLSFLSFGWALMAQIDIDSEKVRWMGNPRFFLTFFVKALAPVLKTYRARLSFLPIPGQKLSLERPGRRAISVSCTDELEDSVSKRDSGHTRNMSCPESMKKMTIHEEDNEDAAAAVAASLGKSSFLDDNELHSSVMEVEVPEDAESIRDLCTNLPPLEEAVPDTWITIEDDFVNFYASYLSHLAVDNHFTPGAQLNDGYIQLMFLGTHVNHPETNIVKVKAFRLEPLGVESGDRGIMTVDGEFMTSSTVQAEVLPGLGRVLASPR